jgi:hypothetical protein
LIVARADSELSAHWSQGRIEIEADCDGARSVGMILLLKKKVNAFPTSLTLSTARFVKYRYFEYDSICAQVLTAPAIEFN